jgi:hypothetical protein
MTRNRVVYCFLIAGLILIGLAARKWKVIFPDFVNTYLGDAIWAAMNYFGMAFLFNKQKLSFILLLSLVFCYCIEVSQLYHAPWIDSIRSTRIGALILGFGFLWSDIVAYTLGIGVAALGEYSFYKSKIKKTAKVA